MTTDNFKDRLVFCLSAACAVCLVTALSGHWAWFAVAVWFVLTLLLAFGLGKQSLRWPVFPALVGVFLVHSAVLLMVLRAHDPTGEAHLFLGLPLGTITFLLGMSLPGYAVGLLAVYWFNRWVVPPERLERFLAEHGRREGDPARG